MQLNFSPISNSNNFKGYDAVPLKNIYMQSLEEESQIPIMEELKEIGKKEDFGVWLQFEKLINSAKDVGSRCVIYNKWAQDNKVIVNDNGKTKIISSKLYSPTSQYGAGEFARLTSNGIDFTDTITEGGNLFIGKKPNGEKWMIVGKDCIELTSKYYFLNDRAKLHSPYGAVKNFACRGEVLVENKGGGERTIREKEWEYESKKYNSRAIKNICRVYGIKKENLTILSQPNFHIDMAIRPVGYPYVLVNNNSLSRENLNILKGKTESFESIKKNFEKHVGYLESEYQESCEIVEQLKQAGFIPIEIGGVYGNGINFLNAIVNQHADGTISYITNSCNVTDNRYHELQEKFEKDLRQKIPNLRDVYFISGKKDGTMNDIMESIQYYLGGIHCLTCEEPNFEMWV